MESVHLEEMSVYGSVQFEVSAYGRCPLRGGVCLW